MLKALIDDHPAGWSTIQGNWQYAPGFTEHKFDKGEDKTDPVMNARPHCFCHGDRSETAYSVTHRNASRMGCEYAYVFDNKGTVKILSSYCHDGKKMVGMFGCGDPKAKWFVMATIGLEDREPDWEQM